ncbi:MAG: hypothetical protein ACR2OU_15610 [Thermomicrobiales bacterium]
MKHTGATGHRGCGVTVHASNLGAAFDATALTLTTQLGDIQLSTADKPLLPTDTQVPSPNFDASGTLKLNTANVHDSVAPGTYSGTLTYTVTSGA